jgi:putative FmdB family regulatory protein
MPIYPYRCIGCESRFDVVKSMSRIDDDEFCPCGSPASRSIGLTSIANTGDWKPTFNPAFGQVVKSKAHQREILSEYKDKGRDFIEVGNEPVENIHKYYDAQREETRNKRWNESNEQILHEALK